MVPTAVTLNVVEAPAARVMVPPFVLNVTPSLEVSLTLTVNVLGAPLMFVMTTDLERLPPELRTRVTPALLSPDSRLSAAGLETLESAGLSGQRAERAWAALAAYTAGFVQLAGSSPELQLEYGIDRLMEGLVGGPKPRKGVSGPSPVGASSSG